MDDLEMTLAGLDLPVPLPEDVRARLEAALLDPLAGLDAPVPLPAALHERLVTVLTAATASSTRRSVRYWLPAAAAAVLVAASLTAVALSGGGTTRAVASRPGAAAPSTTTALAAPLAGAGTSTQNAAGGAGSSGFAASSLATPTTSAPPGVGQPATVAVPDFGPAPPFAFGPSGMAASTAAGPAAGMAVSPATTVPPPVPLRVGIVRGDRAEEAGFAAYLQTLNANGGAGGHTITTVEVAPGTRAAGTIATVNLSGAPIASASGPPSWASGPLLETLLAPSALLHGLVYDFSSAAERQAHLVADAVFPTSAPGSTAVIYEAPSGVLSDVVPAALEQALRARGVTTAVVTYQPGQAVVPVGAQAAFLSLSPSVAHAWLQGAGGVKFPKGVAGVGDLLDPALLALLPAGTDIMSPYALPTESEAAVLSQGVGGAIDAAALHGWVTAKTLAVAVWQSGATTPSGMQTALDGLGGYTDTLRPPYQVRPGTTSRTPEGLLYTVRGGQFVAVGSFRTDSF